MERLAELLFELSNEDRLQILQELDENDLKLTQISKNLDLTAQETSRHLSRLSKSKLIEKTKEGSYDLTEYGRSILKLLPSYIFLIRNRDYFSTHTLSGLPQGFDTRVSELLDSEYIDNAIVLFQMVDSLIAEAEQFVWILSDQALSSTFPLLIEAMKQGVRLRTLLPDSLGAPELPPGMIPDFSVFRDGLMENRHLESVNVIVILSERTGIVSFKQPDGKIDYTGYRIKSDEGIGWCKDLFMYYWKEGVPLSDEEWEEGG